ncbi:hypothetical protein OH77DRAFT_1425800 [Trametes cingulata]|nr:hypothetical protein OH77DRAFT_1425800 [Trametes cingulata]
MAPTRTAESESPTDGETRQRKKPGRAPVSCAECRRLKLRCDRKVPCETCVKRGCAALCPDGSMPTTKGPKKVAADVRHLKRRVLELEAALQALHGRFTDEPHPLLRGDTTPSQPSENGSSAQGSSSTGGSGASQSDDSEEIDPDSEEAEIIDAFGTLTLGTRGEARYFGQTSRSEYLIHAPERLAAYATPKLPHLTKLTMDQADKELDVYLVGDDIGEEMLRCLPTVHKAIHLCEVFFACSKFLWYPLPRDYVMNDILAAVYHPIEGSYCHVTKKHGAALLCMIFALGTLFDMDMPAYAAEAHEFYLLARCALRWAPPAFDTTLASIQALIYMSIYLEMSDCEPAHTGSHKAWMLIRQASTLAQSIGLHVNGRKWQLDSEAAAKRGRVFWQLVTHDAWLSFGYGRPPSISLAFVDCEIPKEEDALLSTEDRDDAAFHVWSWQFARLLHTVMTSAFAAKSPTYAQIFELDRRVRESPVPQALKVPCGTPETPPAPLHLTMQRLFVTLAREMTLVNLHKPFFSLAVKDASKEPLNHKYAPSVMAVYRSLSRILSAVLAAYRAGPGLAARCGIIWSHSLACAILLCLLITRAPASSLAAPCLIDLDKICNLFEEAAGQSQIASNNIEVIRKLKKQAQAAMSSLRAEDDAAVALELDRLGGKTQLIQTLGERIINCHSRARPTPPGVNVSSFEVSNVMGPHVRSTISQDISYNQLPMCTMSLPKLDGGIESPAANGQQQQQQPVAPQFAMDFSSAPPLPELSQSDITALLDFDVDSAMWDPAFGGSWQGNADFLQPNVADAEATWQALVEQLGI